MIDKVKEVIQYVNEESEYGVIRVASIKYYTLEYNFCFLF